MKITCKKLLFYLLCTIVVLLCNGCISAGFYLFSGSDDADYPEFEKSEFYLKRPSGQIVCEKKFSSPMSQEDVRKFVEDNLTEALGVPVAAILPNKEKKFNDSVRLIVYRFPQANRGYMMNKAQPLGMGVGMTFGAFEVFDPILLPFAIYEHILCDEGERYVTVFFDAQNQKTIVYGFNIFTGEIARPPVEAINFMNTYLAWFDHCDEDYSIAEKDRDAAKLYYSKKFYLTDGTLYVLPKDKAE